MSPLSFQPNLALSPRLAVIALGCVLSVGSGFAQEAAQVDASIELSESRAALEITQDKLKALTSRLGALDAERVVLVESLAEAKSENASLRKQFAELTLQLEARGGALASGDQRVLEDRLLKAVRNYDLAQDEVERLSNRLVRLSEVLVTVAESSGMPDDSPGQAMVDNELSQTNQLLTETASGESNAIHDGRVVSLEPSIGLIVLNAGRKQGFRIGMPIEISRTGRYVASATVIDVRDQIAGALLSEVRADSGDVKLGDQAAPQPQL